MFDKWLNEEIAAPLRKSKRVVIADESGHHELIRKVLPQNVNVFTVNNNLEELECKYTIEKFHRNDPVIILSTRQRSDLSFIREYCETCGCLEIRKFENWLTNKVFEKLSMNIALSGKELEAAAFNSIGKKDDYWEDLCRKGGERLFNIGTDILPFLHDPVGFTRSKDPVVAAAFFEKINTWLGRIHIDQPPETLAKEVAEKILGSLLQHEPETKFLEVYTKWLNSKAEDESLFRYAREIQEQIPIAEPWGAYSAHPFTAIDETWFTDLVQNLADKAYITSRLPKIRSRSKTQPGKNWRNGLWDRVLTLLEFNDDPVKELSNFKDAVQFYVTRFYTVDSSIRTIYEEFWGEEQYIRPFQEYYNHLMSPFLYKWFQYVSSYDVNQQGLLINHIRKAKGKTALIVGDGIAYEIAKSVIKKIGKSVHVEDGYRFCGIPSTTENNMSLLYRDDGIIELNNKKRREYLASQVQKTIDFVHLEEVGFPHTDVEVLICSYKDIDEIAEKLQHKALKFIEEIENTLVDKIQFLLKNGFDEVVLTSDHGFVLTGILDESDKVSFTINGDHKKSERYIRTTEKQPELTDLIEIEQMFESFRYLYFSRSMKPFKTPGKYGYAHGGLSPQELIIPWVIFRKQKSVVKELEITIENRSQLKDGIVGEFFSIHLKASESDGELFSAERKVQLLFYTSVGEQFYKSDIVTLSAGQLEKKEFSFDGHHEIDIILIDASSKQTLVKAKVIQKVTRDLGGLF